MPEYGLIYDSSTHSGGLVELTGEALHDVLLRRSRLSADVDTIPADDATVCTITVTSPLESVPLLINGDPITVEPGVDDQIEITAAAPGLIVVEVQGGTARVEIVAEEV
jgi:hypothetical protein